MLYKWTKYFENRSVRQISTEMWGIYVLKVVRLSRPRHAPWADWTSLDGPDAIDMVY